MEVLMKLVPAPRIRCPNALIGIAKRTQLVVGRKDPAFPIQVTVLDGLGQTFAFNLDPYVS